MGARVWPSGPTPESEPGPLGQRSPVSPPGRTPEGEPGPLGRRSALVLASGSPQRQAILTQLGIAFDVVVPGVGEVEDGDPVRVAVDNARRKAEAVRPGPGVEAILAVDTVVTLDGVNYAKPRDVEHAAEMLGALSGREHTVVSGLALRRGGRTELVHAATQVRFRDVAPILQWYLQTGEWSDRAGGYAIQGRGAAFVREIQGDYLNVVGLPVTVLLDLWPGVLDCTR